VPRPTNPTTKKGDRMLKALSLGKSITTAAKAEGVDRTTYYAWRESEPGFAEAADAAIEAGIDILEDEAYRRAKNTSDTLLIFLMKSKRRSIYGDKWQGELTGKDGGPLIVSFGEDPKGPQ
jgi:hypothetical protein